MWRRGRRLAQRYRHGAGKRAQGAVVRARGGRAAPGLVSIDVAKAPAASPLQSEISCNEALRFGKKNRCKKSQRRISFPSRGAGPPASGPRPRRHSQPAGRHASAVSSEGDLRLCPASPVACASRFERLARNERRRHVGRLPPCGCVAAFHEWFWPDPPPPPRGTERILDTVAGASHRTVCS